MLALVASGLVHVLLAGTTVFLATRPVASGMHHVVELVSQRPAEISIVRRTARTGRIGTRSGEVAAALSRQPARSPGNRDEGQPRSARELVAGSDTVALSTQPKNHRTLDFPRRKTQVGRVPALRRSAGPQEEPTPFMARGAARGRAGGQQLAQAEQGARLDPRRRAGESMTRLPLDAALPDPGGRRVAPAPTSRRRTLDLLDAAPTVGRGQARGRGRGSPTARGARTGGADPRFVWLSTPDRRYVDYFQGIHRKIQPLWGFPKKLEVLLEQGDVLVQFTVLSNGSVRDVRVRKSSGYREFDHNVVAAIRKAAPFRPIPAGLGDRLHILAPFEFANPLVR